MGKRKKSISFPSSATKFDVAFRALMLHLAGYDVGSLSPTILSWIRLGIDGPTVYNILLAIYGSPSTPNTWLSVQPIQSNKATRTPTSKQQEKDLMKRALALIRPTRLSLKAKEKITPGFLSADDKKDFYIPDANPHTSSTQTLRISHPVPVLSFFEIGHLEMIIDMHNPDTPKSTAFPEGIIFMELFIYKGATPPTQDSQYIHLRFCPKFRNQVVFTTADLKQDAWFKARFIGELGEEGELSPSIHATITAQNA